MAKTIYVVMNRHKILANRKRAQSEREPVVRVTRGKRGKPVYCDSIVFGAASELMNGLGQPVLPCGATIAIKTTSPITLVTEGQPDVTF